MIAYKAYQQQVRFSSSGLPNLANDIFGTLNHLESLNASQSQVAIKCQSFKSCLLISDVFDVFLSAVGVFIFNTSAESVTSV